MTGVADAPREPSARARVVTRRLREQPPDPEGWRTYSPARPSRRKGWFVVGLLASVALLAVALDPGRLAGWFGDDEGAATPLAAESERPSQAPPAESSQQPTLDEPFRGSPAARWSSGTDGITVPEAGATGWMSQAQVEGALEQSLDFLAAASLDPGVLRGERPEAAIALINPHQQDVRTFLETAFSAPSEQNDPLMLFSRFDTSQARLVGDVVRTRGRITYREGERGALEVTSDVTYVYPVAPAAGGDEVVRTIVRREVVMSWDDPSLVITEPGTFSLVSYVVDMTNGGCDLSTGYLTPPFDTEESEAGTGPEVDPYDRSTSMSERTASDECGTATRS
ncbi:hypothetical protein E1283_30835 [Streptomyces hainanensis]|uniref:Uncharacterized protein n=2 Tax=Streptomyces hainanensis TaxID=402648 RepID=A0A4R4SQ62_9ACTN|nr:hypothetical protein [Streptomyces hainanensis]TDC65176.1 hypothetical protein E1283_30835 [Streptomyces hainanensis]